MDRPLEEPVNEVLVTAEMSPGDHPVANISTIAWMLAQLPKEAAYPDERLARWNSAV